MIYTLGKLRPTLIGEGHFIAPNAAVIGNVILHPDTSVWFSCTLRGDTDRIEIGAGSNIQDGTVIHADPGMPTTIGENVTIGHCAMVHGCTIGDGSLVGIGAVVLNGAKIGRNCLIGAKALVTEGMEIPDGSMVLGAPARIKRALDKETRQFLLTVAGGYRDNARRYLAELETLE